MPSPISSIPKKQPEHYFDDAFVGAVRGRLLTLLGAENDSPENSHSSTESLNSKSSPQPFSYEPADLEQLKADDWFIRRFLKWEPTSVEQAVKTMQQVLAWRKRIAINHWWVLMQWCDDNGDDLKMTFTDFEITSHFKLVQNCTVHFFTVGCRLICFILFDLIV